MRSRLLAVMLGAVLVMGLAGCSKKEAGHPAASGYYRSGCTTGSGRSQPTRLPPRIRRPLLRGRPTYRTGCSSSGCCPQQLPWLSRLRHHLRPQPIVIPAGTNVVVRMGSTLSSKTAQDGQTFTGTLANGIAVNGKVVIPAGSGVTGTVTRSQVGWQVQGRSHSRRRLSFHQHQGRAAQCEHR